MIKNTLPHPVRISTIPSHFGFGFAVVPGPNVTAGGRCFGAPAVGCGRGRGFRGTACPWEGGRGGPRFTYRIISFFILEMLKDPTSVPKLWATVESKEISYAVISGSSPSLELELRVSSSLSDLAPPILTGDTVPLALAPAPAVAPVLQ